MEDLILKAIFYNQGSPKQVQHLLKVHSFAKIIGIKENVDERTLLILEIAAILHDIGIKESYRIYGNSAGVHQEELGPDIARGMIEDKYNDDIVDRVCYLIAHHHTYDQINGIDYQILVEADFLVNLYENNSSVDACRRVYDRIFITESGKELLRSIFL